MDFSISIMAPLYNREAEQLLQEHNDWLFSLLAHAPFKEWVRRNCTLNKDMLHLAGDLHTEAFVTDKLSSLETENTGLRRRLNRCRSRIQIEQSSDPTDNPVQYASYRFLRERCPEAVVDDGFELMPAEVFFESLFTPKPTFNQSILDVISQGGHQ